MNAKERIALAQGVIEAFNRSDWEAAAAPFTDNAIYNEVGTGRQIDGPASFIEAWQGWKEALPDAEGTVTNAVASGNTVLLEITWEGTQDGPLAGPGGTIPPTGRRQVTPAAMVITFKGEKIQESRHYFDMLSLLQQLGAVPEPAQA